MAIEATKLAVKVGSKSDILFNSRIAKAYRAITVRELESIVTVQENIHIVVVENIKESEHGSIKAFINRFKSLDKQNKVFFYVKDNDDFTCGIADEFAYDIYLSLKDLYKAINNTLGINIGTDLTLKDKPISESEVGYDIEDTFDSTFGETLNTINKIQNDALAEETVYELPNIENKDDLCILDASIIEEDTEEVPESTAEIRLENDTISDNDINKAVIIEKPADLSVTIDAKDKEESDAQLNEAIVKLNQLNKLIDALEDEKNNYKNMLDSINENNSIIEEPIALAEYQELADELKKLKIENSNLQETVNNRSKNREEIDKAVETIKGLTEAIDNSNKTIERTSAELQSIRTKLSISENRVAKESMGRIKVIALLGKVACELDATQKSLRDKTNELYIESEKAKSLEVKKNEYEQLILKLNTEINQLKSHSDALDNLIEATKLESTTELNKLKLEKTELQSKLDLIAAQLIAKEYQYNNLVQTYGADENSPSAVIEQNRTLEEINKNLRGQLIMLKTELDQSKMEKASAIQNARNFEEANKQLKISVSAMTNGISGGSAIKVPPCNYTGKGMIIPVFGSGSYGITTTAISIALKLANDSKVLIIDFDMLMPKLDGWLRANPVVKGVPDYDKSRENRFTGLGLLIDRPMNYFLANAGAIICRPLTTKGGYLDFISGIYAKPDTTKLVSSDYTSFFNYCGNNYSYVIIDFGRLGCSEINDGILKMVSDIAYRNVVVTNNDRIEIRNFRNKLVENAIDRNNVAWLLNMCESTKLDDQTRKYLSPTIHSIMPFSESIRGKKADFSKDKLTRDKLEPLMNAIFKK